MSVHFISGKPGGGKTLYSVRLIVDELVHGSRPVVTNVPLKLDFLNEFFQQNYPAAYERRFTATGRHITDDITILDEDDLPKFFTFRGNGVRLESVTNDEWKSGKRPDFKKVKDSGVFYVLDEVHIAFNSRAWAATGNEVLYYLSQHRKLGDDVICITQSIGNVDKQFRSVAQDFTYIKNLSKQRAGLFRLPGIFLRHTYAQPATDNSKSMESGTFTLDVTGLAACYDTAKGVGIHGRSGADTNSRKKGLHWMWFVIGFPILLILAIHYLPRILVHATQPANFPAGKSISTNSAVSKPVVVVAPRPQPSQILPVGSRVPFAPLTNDVVDSETGGTDVRCTGYAVLNGEATVFFSDGSCAYSADGEVEKVERHYVYCRGKKYRVAPSVAVQGQPVQSFNPPVQTSPVFPQSYEPVNDAIILPPIHSATYGMPAPQRINGMSKMQNTQVDNHSYSPSGLAPTFRPTNSQ